MSESKEYQKAIEVCTALTPWSTKQGKLTTLALATEDQVFKELLEKARAVAMSFHVQLSSMKPPMHTIKAVVPSDGPAFTNLTTYCDHQLAARKPQWQVLAERNGWAPGKS